MVLFFLIFKTPPSSSNLHKVFHLSSAQKISIHRHYVTLRIDEVITLHTGQKRPGLRNLCRMNNVRVDITPRTIEINSMYGSTRTVRYLLTGNIGLELVGLSRFSLCSKNLDIFLVNIVNGDIVIVSFVKYLFQDGPDLLVYFVIQLLTLSCCVIYCHSKVFMVQATTRLFNPI